MWRVKRLSALDRHAAFVKRLERQRLARERSGQVSALCCPCLTLSHITLLCGLVCLPNLSACGKFELITVSVVQERAESRVHAAARLHTFTKQLRHAILHNADVASVWRPAAQMLDVKTTLDRKLNNHSFASAASEVAACLALHRPSVCHKRTTVCHKLSPLCDQ